MLIYERTSKDRKKKKLPLTQVARHGRGFHTPDTCQIVIKIIISEKKLMYFIISNCW